MVFQSPPNSNELAVSISRVGTNPPLTATLAATGQASVFGDACAGLRVQRQQSLAAFASPKAAGLT